MRFMIRMNWSADGLAGTENVWLSRVPIVSEKVISVGVPYLVTAVAHVSADMVWRSPGGLAAEIQTERLDDA